MAAMHDRTDERYLLEISRNSEVELENLSVKYCTQQPKIRRPKANTSTTDCQKVHSPAARRRPESAYICQVNFYSFYVALELLAFSLALSYTVEDWTECAQTHRHTKVKTVYPPVSLRSLGGYN